MWILLRLRNVSLRLVPRNVGDVRSGALSTQILYLLEKPSPGDFEFPFLLILNFALYLYIASIFLD